MATLFYENERNNDFLNACEQIRQEAKVKKQRLSMSQIAVKAVYTNAKSFYLHPKAVAQIIRNKGEQLPINKIAKEMHIEIYNRVKNQGLLHLKIKDTVNILSEQQAPRFYISEATAKSLYYKLFKTTALQGV